MMANNRMLSLHFVDGSKISFDFPEQATSAAAKQFKLTEFLKNDHLMIEVEGSFLIFPMANIKYMQIAVAEASAGSEVNLPAHVIRGARIVS
jgi:hypothetical protein